MSCANGYFSTESSPPPVVCLTDNEYSGRWYVSVFSFSLIRSNPSGCFKIFDYCPALVPAIPGYNISTCVTTYYGGSCAVACALGYGTGGADPPDMICETLTETVGKWSARESCDLLPEYCEPTVDAGPGYMIDAVCLNTRLGDHCLLTCSDGYEGSADIQCNIDTMTSGVWSEANGCNLMSEFCPDHLDAEVGYDHKLCANRMLGDQCSSPVCAQGYYGSPAPVSCMVYNSTHGTWSDRVGCFKIEQYCSATIAPQVGYQISECLDTSVDDECTVECAYGYEGSPNNVTCNKNTDATGVWSEPSGCTSMY